MFGSPSAALPPGAPPFGLSAFVLVVAAAVFLPVIALGFLGDDFVYIARFHSMPWAAWPRFFTHEWSDGVWGQPLKELRPFAALSLMIDARLWGGHSAGYHLINLALHLVATALVMRLAWHYSSGGSRAAGLAGLLFAVHPAHVETVTWITGRADLLGSVAALAFFLAGEIYSERGSRTSAVLALVALFVGIFTKEFCLIVPLLLVLRWGLLDPRADRAVWRRRALLFLGALVVTGVYALARRAAFGGDPATGFFGWNDGPAWNRHAAYAGWLVPVLPFTTGSEWTAPPSMGVLRGLWLALAGATGLVLAIAVVRRAAWGNAIFFSGFWWFATTLGLFVVVYFSPRHLYLPTAGVAIGFGLALGVGRVPAILATGIVVWCLAAHFAALQPWRQAGHVSRQAIAVLDADLASADDGTIALVAVPEKLGPVLLWAWSSPQALGAPFLSHPLPAGRVIERPVNYVRSDHWVADHRPLELVRAATGAVALYVDLDGRISHRRVSRAELDVHAETLARLMAQGLNPENLTAWIKACAQP